MSVYTHKYTYLNVYMHMNTFMCSGILSDSFTWTQTLSPVFKRVIQQSLDPNQWVLGSHQLTSLQTSQVTLIVADRTFNTASQVPKTHPCLPSPLPAASVSHPHQSAGDKLEGKAVFDILCGCCRTPFVISESEATSQDRLGATRSLFIYATKSQQEATFPNKVPFCLPDPPLIKTLCLQWTVLVC